MSWGHGIDIPMPFETRLIAHEYALGAAMPVVRSSDEAWEAFARADEEFRTALNHARQEVSRVLTTNCFGDCVEGKAMYSRVTQVLGSGSQSISSRLTNQADYLEAHSAMCRRSHSRIDTTDELSSRSGH